MFRATWDLVEELTHRLQKDRESSATATGNQLSEQLLNRVIAAAMLCPGFTPLQKDDIAAFVEMSEEDARSYGMPRCAASWRHQYAMAPKSGVPLDIIEVCIYSDHIHSNSAF